MKLYVTRHGQTDWNVQGKTQGRTDIELNEVGIEQAKQTKKELKNRFNNLFTIKESKKNRRNNK